MTDEQIDEIESEYEHVHWNYAETIRALIAAIREARETTQREITRYAELCGAILDAIHQHEKGGAEELDAWRRVGTMALSAIGGRSVESAFNGPRIRELEARVAELEAQVAECEQWPSPRYTSDSTEALRARGFQRINARKKQPLYDAK